MYTVKDARQNTIDALTYNQIFAIIHCIKEEAKNGKFNLILGKELQSEVVEHLRELGFKVNYNNDTNKTTIDWSYND